MSFACKYVALFVPELQAAEDFYCDLLGMEVLCREAEQDGDWDTLRSGVNWSEALSSGGIAGRWIG